MPNYIVRERVASLMAWWLRELRALFPARLRGALFSGREDLRLEVAEGTKVTLSVASPKGTQILQRHDDPGVGESAEWVRFLHAQCRGRKLVLVLPDSAVLSKVVELPLAVEENLSQVLAYEMDRHTPFSPSEVYHGFRVLGRRPVQGRLRVQLELVPRPVLDAWLERLAGWGMYPDRVIAASEPAVDLLPQGLPVGSQRSERFRLAMGAAVLGLIMAIVLTPLWHMRQVVVALNQEAGRLEHAANRAATLQARRDELQRQADILLERRRSQPYAARVLDEMARVLPDATWVQNLTLLEDSVMVSGASNSASGLIELIEASPLFEGASFSAPVTRHPTTGGDRFQISARVRVVRG